MKWFILLISLILLSVYVKANLVENFSTSHGTVMQLVGRGPQDVALIGTNYHPLDSIPTKTVRLPPNYIGWYPYKFDYRRSSMDPSNYIGNEYGRIKHPDNTYSYQTSWPQLVGTNVHYAKWFLEKQNRQIDIVSIPYPRKTPLEYGQNHVYLVYDDKNIVTEVPRMG